MSSIVTGFETAARDLAGGGRRVVYASDWLDGSRGIEINGLIWMGDKQLMLERVREKIEAGFTVLKLKIGGIDFDEELDILAHIRRQFSPSDLTIRLDANGSFSVGNALDRLDRLSRYAIHSIEQPIKAGQIADMALICRRSPIDIALDEELIGVTPDDRKLALLSEIRPRYIILKPTLCGGFAEADKWISTADGLGIGWWATFGSRVEYRPQRHCSVARGKRQRATARSRHGRTLSQQHPLADRATRLSVVLQSGQVLADA